MDDLVFTDVDYSQIQELEFDNTPVKAGSYMMQIKKVTFSKGRDTETPYLKWQLVHTHQDLKLRGSVFENTMLAGKGAFRTKQLLSALGVGEADKFQFAVEGIITDDNRRKGIPVRLIVNGNPFEPVGTLLNVVLNEKTSPGQSPRNEVEKYLPAS